MVNTISGQRIFHIKVYRNNAPLIVTSNNVCRSDLPRS